MTNQFALKQDVRTPDGDGFIPNDGLSRFPRGQFIPEQAPKRSTFIPEQAPKRSTFIPDQLAELDARYARREAT